MGGNILNWVSTPHSMSNINVMPPSPPHTHTHARTSIHPPAYNACSLPRHTLIFFSLSPSLYLSLFISLYLSLSLFLSLSLSLSVSLSLFLYFSFSLSLSLSSFSVSLSLLSLSLSLSLCFSVSLLHTHPTLTRNTLLFVLGFSYTNPYPRTGMSHVAHE